MCVQGSRCISLTLGIDNENRWKKDKFRYLKSLESLVVWKGDLENLKWFFNLANNLCF
jgi:hypothetical protein